ncbi:hypothetical protein COOONC_04426 [Cooperia oncophora]
MTVFMQLMDMHSYRKNVVPAGKIHLSFEAQLLLAAVGGYEVESRGEIIVKGKGVMETFWLVGTSSNPHRPPLREFRNLSEKKNDDDGKEETARITEHIGIYEEFKQREKA